MKNILPSVESLAQVSKKLEPSKVVLVTTPFLKEKLAATVGRIEHAMRSASALTVITVPDGEAAKSLAETEILLKKFIDAGVDKHSLVLILGGGSTGDAAAFACSVYKRGVPYVQVPTTLVSMVDSAHGGKTAVNFLGYKNQLGTTYDPVAVVVDVGLLRELPEAQIVDGLGEIIKYGLIKDKKILKLLEGKTAASLASAAHAAIVREIVDRSIAVKYQYAKKDKGDTGIRQMLNFGHTIGHALEMRHAMSHGMSVLVGMMKELEMGEKLGLTAATVRAKYEGLLKSLGIRLNTGLVADWDAILKDKKISGDTIAFPVVLKEGRSKLVELKLSRLKELL